MCSSVCLQAPVALCSCVADVLAALNSPPYSWSSLHKKGKLSLTSACLSSEVLSQCKSVTSLHKWLHWLSIGPLIKSKIQKMTYKIPHDLTRCPAPSPFSPSPSVFCSTGLFLLSPATASRSLCTLFLLFCLSPFFLRLQLKFASFFHSTYQYW